MVKQINVFSENRPGKLEQITGVLAAANVNIIAVKISSDEEYGVLKFLVDDPEKGFRAFKQAGVTVSLKDVLAVGVENKPGNLHASHAAHPKERQHRCRGLLWLCSR
ncbi:MAG TPA: ACT domain-containing protein [Candidatus Bathyarchaeia archaeon]|nr:ACT domain-containing protein [Candidatus Bathyarchaeia archaeon]